MIAVAVCGLGLMGGPVAVRLAQAGYGVSVWDRTPARTAPFMRSGVTVAPSPAAATAGAQVAIVLVSDANAVRSVMSGPEGMVAGRPRVIAQMSTIAPHEIVELARGLPPDVHLLDSPVTGSVPQVVTGQLRVLTGGGDEACALARPVLETLGTVVPCGPLGAAAALKCVLNACVSPMMALLAEGLALADTLGLDPYLTLDELERTRVGPLVVRKRAMIEGGEFPADSRLRLFAKDMEIAEATAAHHGTRLRLAGQARLLAGEAMAAGLGDLDYSVLAGFLRGQKPPGPSAD
ncbi:NAD(P)-dependent oxidoreductase [Streptomyces sp. NPDC048504]|uniref:NAD(P)-dependent oxidoreductase n=1 Tax=Streptomyces sp. NPDC048504 TaxID=3365559 RepID=UPI0037237F7F